MNERPITFRVGGLDGHLSEAEWPGHLPLPTLGLIVIRMPNHEHRGIAVDRNNITIIAFKDQKVLNGLLQ